MCLCNSQKRKYRRVIIIWKYNWPCRQSKKRHLFLPSDWQKFEFDTIKCDEIHKENTERVTYQESGGEHQWMFITKVWFPPQCRLLLHAYCLHLPSKVCRGLIPVMGLDVARGERVGFEDNVVSPYKKTLSDEDPAGSSSKRKFLFRQRKGLLPCQGVSSSDSLYSFFLDQFPDISIKRTQRSCEFGGGCNLRISSLRHWVCSSPAHSNERPETPVSEALGSSDRTSVDSSEHLMCLCLSSPLLGNPSDQPTLSTFSLHFYCHHRSTATAWSHKASLSVGSSLQTTPSDNFKMCLLLQAMDYQNSIFHNFLIHQIRYLILEPHPHGFLSQGHFWMVTHYITLLLELYHMHINTLLMQSM